MNVHVTIHGGEAVVEEISEAPTRVRMTVSSHLVRKRMPNLSEATFDAQLVENEFTKTTELQLGDRLPTTITVKKSA